MASFSSSPSSALLISRVLGRLNCSSCVLATLRAQSARGSHAHPASSRTGLTAGCPNSTRTNFRERRNLIIPPKHGVLFVEVLPTDAQRSRRPQGRGADWRPHVLRCASPSFQRYRGLLLFILDQTARSRTPTSAGRRQSIAFFEVSCVRRGGHRSGDARGLLKPIPTPSGGRASSGLG